MIRDAAAPTGEDDELEALLHALRDGAGDGAALRKATAILRRQLRMREAYELGSRHAGGDATQLVEELDRIAAVLGPALADADAHAQDATVARLARHTIEGRDPELPSRERLAVARHLLEAGQLDEALPVLRGLDQPGEIGRIARLLEAGLRFDRLEFGTATELIADTAPGPWREVLLRRLEGLRELSARAVNGREGADSTDSTASADGTETTDGPGLVRRAVRGYVGSPVSTAANHPPRVVLTTGSLGAGGAEMQLCRLAVLLVSCGIDVRVLHDDRVPASEGLVQLLAGADVPVHRFADFADGTHRGEPPDRPTDHLLGMLAERPSFHGLHTALRIWQPDVVHVMGDAATFLERTGLVAKASGVPRIVLSARTLSPPDRPDLLANPAYRRKTAMSRAMLAELVSMPGVRFEANCAAGLESFRRWLDGLPPTSAELPNLVDADRIAEEASTPIDPPWPPGSVVIGGAFRLYGVKRPLLWLEVARRLGRGRPDLHFAIAGDGPMAAEVASAASGIANLHLLGHRSPAAPWLRSFTTFLLTSSAEGLPNACMEAQAVGVPVVASDVGGMSQTFRDGLTGFLVRDIDDPDAYVHAILATLDDPWRATAVREAPRHVAQRCGPLTQLEILLPLYGLRPDEHPIDHTAWAETGTIR